MLAILILILSFLLKALGSAAATTVTRQSTTPASVADAATAGYGWRPSASLFYIPDYYHSQIIGGGVSRFWGGGRCRWLAEADSWITETCILGDRTKNSTQII